jgi:predicted small metal-binding protein
MKKMKCVDMGGTCNAEMTAETAQEMMKKGGDHVNEMAAKGDHAHIALKAQMDGAMTDKEAMDAWTKMFYGNWDKAQQA